MRGWAVRSGCAVTLVGVSAMISNKVAGKNVDLLALQLHKRALL